MSDLDCIHAAILDRPGDDTPRGACADWLDEYAADMPDPGGARLRAEFIRTQVELARMPECDQLHCWPANTACNGYCDLRRRERELWGDYGREWFGDTALWLPTDDPRASPHVTGYVVRRGFIDEVRTTMAAFAGGPCPHPTCVRGQIATNAVGRRPCGHCAGTGTRPGLAAALGRLPLSRVTLTDREPLRFTPDSGSGSSDWPDRFAWGRQGRQSDDGSHWIRDDLWHLITSPETRAERYKRFDTRAAARAALSAALVAHCRSLAGLPPLA